MSGQSPYNNALEFSHLGSTVASTGANLSCGVLQIIQDTVLHSVGASNISNADSLVGITLTAGTNIYGKISSFTASNGAVLIAHNRYTA